MSSSNERLKSTNIERTIEDLFLALDMDPNYEDNKFTFSNTIELCKNNLSPIDSGAFVRKKTLLDQVRKNSGVDEVQFNDIINKLKAKVR